jgi:hypothetical protein
MSTVDALFAPESFEGPYADFYRRAITELLCWRLLRESTNDGAALSQEAVDPLAFDAIGIQFGNA